MNTNWGKNRNIGLRASEAPTLPCYMAPLITNRGGRNTPALVGAEPESVDFHYNMSRAKIKKENNKILKNASTKLEKII